jgi:hypothetical protein
MKLHWLWIGLLLSASILAFPAHAQNETNTTNSTTNITTDINTTVTTNVTNNTQTTDERAILVMKHLCGPEIQSETDLDQLGDSISQEKACPTVILTKDEFSSSTIHGEEGDFNIIVQGETGPFVSINDATFTQARACETDLNRDLNNDGQITADQCMDTSYYRFSNVSFGNVTVTELTPLPGTRFGAVKIGPDVRVQQTLNSSTNGVVELDTRRDATNGSIMVHIFNFRNNQTFVTRIVNALNPSDATLSIKPPYPKGSEFVFICDVDGFTPTSYSWFYGDGEKLINIQNGDTFHRYATTGAYNVTCMGTDGTNTASASLTVNVSTVSPPNTTFTNTGFCASGLTCDGSTLSITQCQSISCANLCVGGVCFANVTNMQVCPNQQFVNTGFNTTNVSNTTNTCFTNVVNIPASCIGGDITQDTDMATFDNCRHVTCSDGNSSLTVKACEKPDEINPQYFELMKESQTGSGIEQVCIGDTCIAQNGFAFSSSFPICTTGNQTAIRQSAFVNTGFRVNNSNTSEMNESAGFVTICHMPPGEPANAHTIVVSANALAAHQAHGDTLGACAVTNVSNTTNSTNTTNTTG